MLRTAALSENPSSIQLSSLRLGNSLLNQSAIGLSGRSSRALSYNTDYRSTTTALTSSQASYSFQPSSEELSRVVDYSYAATTQRVGNRRHHRGAVATTLVAAGVPDTGTSLLLFVSALAGFAALRLVPAIRRSVAA